VRYISKIVSFYQNIPYCQLKVHWNFNSVCTDFIAISVPDELDCVAVSDFWCMRRIVLCVTISGLTQNLVECGHRVKVITHLLIVPRLTLRRLMSYIYMEHPFLMFLDHTQQRSTVGRTPLDE